MPHEHTWIDDCVANHQADLRKSWQKAADVMEVQNRAMRTVLNECPFDLRTPETCRDCGNENCIIAYKEQNEIWGKDSEEPAYRAGTTNTRQAAATSYAKSKLQNTQKSPPHGQPASGLTLFDLMVGDEKEKAA